MFVWCVSLSVIYCKVHYLPWQKRAARFQGEGEKQAWILSVHCLPSHFFSLPLLKRKALLESREEEAKWKNGEREKEKREIRGRRRRDFKVNKPAKEKRHSAGVCVCVCAILRCLLYVSPLLFHFFSFFSLFLQVQRNPVLLLLLVRHVLRA